MYACIVNVYGRHDTAPEWTWNAEDWGLLRGQLDLEQEAKLGYTYGVDPPPHVKGGKIAPVRKPTKGDGH